MNEISIFIFLFSVTALFIILYIFIKFVLSEKRSFTFEIISIPLGIFKFDKRDEFLKKKKARSDEYVDKIETENNETDLVETYDDDEDYNECFVIAERLEAISEENEDKQLYQNDIMSEENEILPEDLVNMSQEDILKEEANQKDSDKKDSVLNVVNEEIKSPEYNTDIIQQFEDEYNEEDDENIVYWTASGKAYHTSKKCRTLSRSKVIFNGTVEDSGRYVKCVHCNK